MKAALKEMATKDFGLQVKAVDETAGTFEGLLSVYNVVDLGGDMVEPGAFTKTIQENGGKVPMLWQHKTDEPIGLLELKDTAEGLAVVGTFDLNIEKARDAYSLVRKGIIKGLSIGYRAIKKKMESGVRHLKEIELFEGSVVTFPMLPVAQISTVKGGVGTRKDFMSELADAQTYAMREMMFNALYRCLSECMYEDDMTREERSQMASDSIDQFKEQFIAFLPAFFDLMGMKGEEQKAGRRISASSRAQIEEAIQKLQALLAEEAADTEGADAAAASTSEPKAATTSTEPDVDLHSMLESFRKSLTEVVAA